jgi:hypothetical protein
MPVIVAELELGDIEVQVLFAELVETSHDAALNQRPKALNGLGVNCADNVFLFLVINADVVWILPLQIGVAGRFIGAEQGSFMRNGFADERRRVEVRDFSPDNAIPQFAAAIEAQTDCDYAGDDLIKEKPHSNIRSSSADSVAEQAR